MAMIKIPLRRNEDEEVNCAHLVRSPVLYINIIEVQ